MPLYYENRGEKLLTSAMRHPKSGEYGSLTVYYGWGHLDRYFAGFKQWIEAEFNQRHSFKHLQGYLDEYNFRVRHRRNPQRNFDILMREAVKSLNKST